MHQCEHNLETTDNIMLTATGIHYKVLICRECKRYYIKRFNHLFGVEMKDGRWQANGDNIMNAFR